MIKIDERIFKKFNVKLAYLFGSYAKSSSAPESDIDIAVLFKEQPSDPLALKETTFLSLELAKFFPQKVDVISLNNASLLLKYEVVSSGRILYCESETDRINFEVSVTKEYIDEAPIRDIYNQALYKKILQGG